MTTPPTLMQQRAIAYSPKPFGVISLFASFYVIRHLIVHPDKKERLYHRLVGYMNVAIIFRSIAIIWGNWAVPKGTPYFAGALGTVGTCTAQGFISILTSISVASYYASLSICSFISVKHKFKEEEYKWNEKWIHFVCVCLPLAYSIWMITEENINPYGSGCYGASSPLGCQADPDLVCERVSDRINLAMLIVGLGQIIIYFVIPPCSMLALYLFLGQSKKRSQSSKGMRKIIEAARKKMLWDVMLQIALYLFSFWGTYVLGLVHFVIQTITGKISYNLLIVANALTYSQGFIVMLVYFQLQRMTKRNDSTQQAQVCEGRNRDTVQTIRTRASSRIGADNGIQATNRRRSNEVVFSIFDGTPDESSPWAKYIDQETEEDDEFATEH